MRSVAPYDRRDIFGSFHLVKSPNKVLMLINEKEVIMLYDDLIQPEGSYLAHHGVKGMRWGVRRYQNEDGSLTDAGKKKYINENKAYKKYGKQTFYNPSKNPFISRIKYDRAKNASRKLSSKTQLHRDLDNRLSNLKYSKKLRDVGAKRENREAELSKRAREKYGESWIENFHKIAKSDRQLNSIISEERETWLKYKTEASEFIKTYFNDESLASLEIDKRGLNK